uniref:Nucleotidyl transferase (GMPP) n=1 Tax=uncultured marine thaumarchaeote SAT1000_10_G06 TaxID=1456374 RepID=A0A075I4G5_9ARCH|nr:nucleotidyl transferase (GMPP) [uncultured marine thaumarchaeote SAT1000_10_G06]
MSRNLHVKKRNYSKNKEEKQKQVNLSYDILQELSKEGKVSAYDIADKEWVDAESPMILERNKKLVTKIIKQMGL